MALKPHLIGGEWVEGSEAADDINPSNIDDVVGEYARADRALAEQRDRGRQGGVPGLGAQHAAAALRRARRGRQRDPGAQGRARRAALARGRQDRCPRASARSARAGQIFKFFAGEALRLAGERVPSVRPGIEVEITREPLGVVGLITPWNFPIAIPAWKIAPALAYGNCVVFKPADLVPGSAWALAEIMQRAGLPDGVFNLVMGRGSVVGEALLESPDVAAISFTGSVDTGRRIAAKCAARLAKFQLEMGGKNPLVVLDDADLDVAVSCAVQGAFFSTGQRCTASSRLIVTEGIHDRFVEAMVEAHEASSRSTTRSSTAPRSARWSTRSSSTRTCATSRSAGKEGGKLAFGGERLEARHPGLLPARRRCSPRPRTRCASTARRSSGRSPP